MRFLLSIAVAALLAVASWYMPSSWAQPTQLTPNVTVTTLAGATGAQIIAANPTRRSLRICNTGATNAVWIWAVAQGAAATTLVSSYILAPVTSSVITCYTPPANAPAAATAAYAGAANATGTTVSVEEWR